MSIIFAISELLNECNGLFTLAETENCSGLLSGSFLTQSEKSTLQDHLPLF